MSKTIRSLEALNKTIDNISYATDNGIEGLDDSAHDNYDMLQGMLDNAGSISFNWTGTLYVSKGLGVKSDTILSGLGKDVTKIALMINADVETNLLSNYNHKMRVENSYSTSYDIYDENIEVHNLTLDWKGHDRGAITCSGNDSCTLNLSGARNVVVDSISGYSPKMHGCSLGFMGKINDGAFLGHWHYDEPGRSNNIVIRNSDFYNSIDDDGITTHYAHTCKFINCRAIHEDSHRLELAENQNGIEIDGGSEYIDVLNCYSFGYKAGFAAIGHENEAPARNILFYGNTAEQCRIGILTWNRPEEIPIEDRAELTNARGVIFRDTKVIDMTAIEDKQDECMPASMSGYSDVLISGLLVKGMTDRYLSSINQTSSVIGGANIDVEHVLIRDVQTIVGSQYCFMVLENLTYYEAENISFRDITLVGGDGYGSVLHDADTGNKGIIYAEKIQAIGTTDIDNIVTLRATNFTGSGIMKGNATYGILSETSMGWKGFDADKLCINTGTIFSDIYTPTIVEVSGCTVNSVETAYYSKTGTGYTITGRCQVVPSALDAMFEFKISMPPELIYNFSAGGQATGVASTTSSNYKLTGVSMYAGTGSLDVMCRGYAEGTSAVEGHFMYSVVVYG